MSVLSILKIFPENYGFKDFCLNKETDDVLPKEFNTPELQNILVNMFDTLYDFPSGVGLAANQVGIMKKICVIDYKRDGKKGLVCINPTYIPLSEAQSISKEQCLSFPKVSADVPRFNKIKVTYQDFFGNRCSIDAEGFKAFVLQHEIDHLHGITFIDLINIDKDLCEYAGYSNKLANNAVRRVINEQ